MPGLLPIEHYSTTKKNEAMSFAATLMDVEIIILSEVRTNTQYHLYMESKKMLQITDLQNRSRFTDTENKRMVTKGERGGRDKLGVWD